MTPEPTAASEKPVIQAAGGILVRKTDSRNEVLLVHRKRYGDWTFPKGKLNPGESHQQAALREVHEETGFVASLDRYLGAFGYEVKGTPKIVLMWRMSPVEEGPIGDREEVAESAWVSIHEARQRLSYDLERELMQKLEPQHQDPIHPRRKRTWAWSSNQRSRDRLFRELEVFRVELAFLEHRGMGSGLAWADAARRHLDNVPGHLESGDIESGWRSLQAAQRTAVLGLDPATIGDRARILREESQKLSSWRAKSIQKLLSCPDQDLTADRLIEALALRDEFAQNQYHKIDLMGDQLKVLLAIAAGALLLLLIMFYRRSGEFSDPWSFTTIAMVLLVGVLAASFSAAQSLITNTGGGKIPERVANHFVTIARALFGATAALGGYLLYKSDTLKFTIGDNGIGASLAIAFLFGFAGERLISRITNTGQCGQAPDLPSGYTEQMPISRREWMLAALCWSELLATRAGPRRILLHRSHAGGSPGNRGFEQHDSS